MKQYRVYHPDGGQMRLAATVMATSKAAAIVAAAEKRGMTGYPAYLFGKVAKARLISSPKQEAIHAN